MEYNNGMKFKKNPSKIQLPTDITNSENYSDSYEFQVFSLKEVCPELLNSSALISPNSMSIGPKVLARLDENSTNSSRFFGKLVSDEEKSSVGTSITEFKLATMNSPERKKLFSQIGSSPFNTYCGYCKELVFSTVEIKENDLGYFERISQILSMCCGSIEYGARQVIHKCPNCDLVLAKLNNY